MKQMFVATSMLATLSCFAQDAPSAVKSEFAKKFPGIAVKKWDKEDDMFEANFTKDSKKT